MVLGHPAGAGATEDTESALGGRVREGGHPDLPLLPPPPPVAIWKAADKGAWERKARRCWEMPGKGSEGNHLGAFL